MGLKSDSLLAEWVEQGSLNVTHLGGDQTVQMYVMFLGFPLNSALFGLVI